jgi:hypothetical protein
MNRTIFLQESLIPELQAWTLYLAMTRKDFSGLQRNNQLLTDPGDLE